ncbi:MAG: GNAT family N-acetyltransferase [Allosphingosinicella sp.]
MRIRAARASDIKAMHALRLSVGENRLSDPRQVAEADYLPYFAQGAAWVAETGRGLAGFAILDVAGGSVWALFVAPEAEGIGIGRALHARLIEGAIAHGPRRLSLGTAPGTRAERFYAEAGWVRAGMTASGELTFRKDLTG